MSVKSVSAFSCPTGSRFKKDHGLLRDWQQECVNDLRGSRQAVIQSPTGSGKSIVCMVRGAIALRDNSNLKHLVSVPQRIIAESFKKPLESKVSVIYKKSKLAWVADEITDIDKVDALCDFITSKKRARRILVCTHQALVAAFTKLQKSDNLDSFRNVMLTIDEVHHSASITVEEETIIDNRLAETVRFYFENDLLIDMFTATFMRANYFNIIPAGFEYKKYIRYIDEHLAEILPKGTVSIRFLIGKPEEALKTLYEEDPNKKTIVYLPSVMSKMMQSFGNKYAALSALRKSVKKKISSVDLVSEEGRENRRRVFLDSIDTQYEPDLLFALNMCKEGFDWPAASRSVVIGPRGSMVDMIQMLGRLLRYHPSKKSIEFIVVLPHSKDPEQIRTYLGFMIQSLIVEYQMRKPKFANLSEDKVAKKVFEDETEIGIKALEKVMDSAIKAPDEADADETIRKGLDKVNLTKEEKDELAPILKHMLKGLGKSFVESTYKPEMVSQAFGKLRSFAALFGHADLKKLRTNGGWLTESMVYDAAKKRFEKTGSWPSQISKDKVTINGSTYTWGALHQALVRGGHGLPGGKSLSDLLTRPIDIDLVLEAARVFNKENGKTPNNKSPGKVFGMPYETWNSINMSFVHGTRGLTELGYPAGWSLPKFLAYNGMKNTVSKGKLDLENIKKLALQFYKKHGQWPNQKSGKVGNENWGSINAALRSQCRGLNTEFRSLSELCFQVANEKNLPTKGLSFR